MFDRDVEGCVALGLVLTVLGIPFAAYAYYVLLNVPLTVLGLACVILGATMFLIPSSPVPPQTVRAMVEASCVNVEALLEEMDAREKGVYLPPRDDRGWAYVPLSGNPGLDNAWEVLDAPVRVVTDAGGEPGLMVFPPGSEVVRLSMLGEEVGLEEALSYVLVDFLEGAESVKATHAGGDIVLKIQGSRLETDFPRYRSVLGSLPVSLAGSVLAAITGRPVKLLEESEIRGEIRAVFREVARDG